MEIAALVISLVAVIAAVASAVYARGANRRADIANDRAREANEIAAQALKVQQQALPPTWSAIESLGGDVVGFRNQSSRAIVVTSLAAEPDAAAGLVEADPRPIRVEYGDLLALRVGARLTLAPQSVDIAWHFEDEGPEASHLSKRKL